MDNTNLLIIVTVIVVARLCFISNRQEGFRCKNYRPGDVSHCPRACNPFQYPDMYSVPPCADPLNWGFTYSTGRCPHAYSPEPRRLPSPAKESFGQWFTHGGGASYNDPKHTESSSYGYNYS